MDYYGAVVDDFSVCLGPTEIVTCYDSMESYYAPAEVRQIEADYPPAVVSRVKADSHEFPYDFEGRFTPESDRYNTSQYYVSVEMQMLLAVARERRPEKTCSCERFSDASQAYNGLLQSSNVARPEVSYGVSGPDHAPMFVGVCDYRGYRIRTRQFSSKRDADKHVAHIIVQHVTADEEPQAYASIVSSIFQSTLRVRDDNIQWFYASDHVALLERRGEHENVHICVSPDRDQAKVECMHAYNSYHGAYEFLPEKSAIRSSLVKLVSVSATPTAVTFSTPSCTQTVEYSDHEDIRFLKFVRVLCGSVLSRAAVRTVLTGVAIRDNRSYGHITVGSLNTRVLVDSSDHARVLERLPVFDMLSFLNAWEELEGKRAVSFAIDHLFSCDNPLSLTFLRLRPIVASPAPVALNVPPLSSILHIDVVLQGQVYQITGSPDGLSSVNEVYRRWVAERRLGHELAQMANWLFEVFRSARTTLTSQECVKAVRRLADRPIVKSLVHKTLSACDGALWSFVPIGPDKAWKLRARSGSYKDLCAYVGSTPVG